jgi:hypothetical protein
MVHLEQTLAKAYRRFWRNDPVRPRRRRPRPVGPHCRVGAVVRGVYTENLIRVDNVTEPLKLS